MKEEVLILRTTKEMKEQLKKISKRKNITISSIVTTLLREYIEQNKMPDLNLTPVEIKMLFISAKEYQKHKKILKKRGKK